MYEEQTKEQREAKAPKRVYIGNGKIFWTDGKYKLQLTRVERETVSSNNSLMKRTYHF